MNKFKTAVMPTLVIGIYVIAMILLTRATTAPECGESVPFFLRGTVHECQP